MAKLYESEFTLFMHEWLEKHPKESEVQRTGQALWWDRPQDPEAARRFEAARVPVNPYYYDIAH
ncbi:MAG: DUF3460 family protein [Proteobacteria bacterium]|jgi:hypothetical protein|nr:DUF3460 family protein [Pseudomonadota bacterium]